MLPCALGRARRAGRAGRGGEGGSACMGRLTAARQVPEGSRRCRALIVLMYCGHPHPHPPVLQFEKPNQRAYVGGCVRACVRACVCVCVCVCVL